ncbi:Fe-S cluster assembly sulfur transfer protein SufU [Lactiplantibacillus modestisalitolerans]|uniref:Fe-S cluster assembly sulfur transfer protein SufU n=1 Tax=Lactiplantibacillus modestisalitolerans TaxID=1457219 RepID=A0ABV5WS06_9LACO|nr:SUF system NifU family Fe-S cluster assembly protein [Lactiplantibacillus modestisalitolerans]
MSLDQMNELYREVVLDHAQHPHHKGHLGQESLHFTMENPTCGDVIDVATVVKDGQIDQLAFTGAGCTISQASASMMTVALLHRPVAEARRLIVSFSKMITGATINDQDQRALGDASLLASVAEFPARIKCATLAWHALDELLQREGSQEHE